jgi:hypothetical protein
MDKTTTAGDSATVLDVDVCMAQRYLRALGALESATYQTFDDSPEKRRHLARILQGSFSDNVIELCDLNRDGAGVFVTVNQTDLKGRSAANVTALRACFVDGDDVPFPTSWHTRPDFIVWRSKTRWHAYWKLSSDTPLESFKGIQERLAAYYHTDPKIKDLPRVMRIPGFVHRKGVPTMVRFKDWRKK